MNDEQLHTRLEAVGSRIVDDPDGLVVAGIERRLLAGHQTGRRRTTVLWPVLAGVAAAVAIVVGFVDNDPAPAPLDTVGVEGTFGPPPTTVTSTTSAQSTTEATEPDRADDERPVAPPATTTEGEAAPPTTASIAAVSSSTTTEFRSPPDTAPADDGSPPDTRPPADAPRPLRAGVHWRDGRAVLVWDDPVRDDVVAWSIVREVRLDADSPETRGRILEDGRPELRRFVDDPPPRGRVAYVVAGHRSDGEVVVRSERLVLRR